MVYSTANFSRFQINIYLFLEKKKLNTRDAIQMTHSAFFIAADGLVAAGLLLLIASGCHCVLVCRRCRVVWVCRKIKLGESQMCDDRSLARNRLMGIRNLFKRIAQDRLMLREHPPTRSRWPMARGACASPRSLSRLQEGLLRPSRGLSKLIFFLPGSLSFFSPFITKNKESISVSPWPQKTTTPLFETKQFLLLFFNHRL